MIEAITTKKVKGSANLNRKSRSENLKIKIWNWNSSEMEEDYCKKTIEEPYMVITYLNPNDRWRPSLSEKTTGDYRRRWSRRETKAWSGLNETAGSSCKTRQLHCFELLWLCDESPASTFCDCEIRASQRKFNDDGNGSMKMLVPTARILVDEDAKSSSTLAFVYWW